MHQEKLIQFVSILLTFYPLFGSGQFPAECATEENLRLRECCPNNCNAESGRGECIDIDRQQILNQWSKADPYYLDKLADIIIPNITGKDDARIYWPARVYSRICSCRRPFYGADCGECIFGYIGDNCTERRTLLRRPLSEISKDEKKELLNTFIRAKEEKEKRWAVIIDEDAPGVNFNSKSINSTTGVTLQNVSTYHFFVFLHFYASRDVNSCQRVLTIRGGSFIPVDFAHGGPGFLTWHRYYLLWLEREIGKVIGNPNFALPYWNWEEYKGHDLFVDDLFGARYSVTEPKCKSVPKIGGKPWIAICDGFKYFDELVNPDPPDICTNVNVDINKVRECNVEEDVTFGNLLCRGGPEINHILPGTDQIKIALPYEIYHSADFEDKWNVRSVGFANALEGNIGLHCNDLNNGTLQLYSDGEGILQDEEYLHNSVHGYFGGHLIQVTPSANDPIFFLHHAQVDRIYEMWLRKEEPAYSYLPSSGAHPGHNCDDWIVPFFPLVTNCDMHQISTELGYDYANMTLVEPQHCTAKNLPTTNSASNQNPILFAGLFFLIILFPVCM